MVRNKAASLGMKCMIRNKAVLQGIKWHDKK
jgi:hypothetical protein